MAEPPPPNSVLLLCRAAPAASARSALRAAALAEGAALARNLARRRAAVRAQLAAAEGLEAARLAAAGAFAADGGGGGVGGGSGPEAAALQPLRAPCRCAPLEADALPLTAGAAAGACRGAACGCGAAEAAASSAPAANWYRGRPLAGATSGAQYLAAEAAGGLPPPRRADFVFPPETLPGPSGAGGGGGALNPSVLAEAQGVLKRPSFADRGYALGAPGAGGARAGAGSALLRRLAAARDADDAALGEERLAGLHAAALRAIARV